MFRGPGGASALAVVAHEPRGLAANDDAEPIPLAQVEALCAYCDADAVWEWFQELRDWAHNGEAAAAAVELEP